MGEKVQLTWWCEYFEPVANEIFQQHHFRSEASGRLFLR